MGIGALRGVGEGSGRREDGGEDAKRKVGRGRATSLALIDSRCDDMRPFVPLVFIREMPNSTETRGLVVYAPIRRIVRKTVRTWCSTWARDLIRWG
jgi:hypothetical protein